MSDFRFRHAARLGLWGSIISAAGIVLSGPLGLLFVDLVHPQPSWQGAPAFVEHFHPIQSFPFFIGFLLVSGYVMMIAAIHGGATERGRHSSLVALVFASAFAALIFFNYIVQTTFVPSLVADYSPEYDPVIAAFTMANPASLGWGVEMWGYGFLGVATLLCVPAFRQNGLERAAAVLFILNGIVSLVGAFLTAFMPGWVLTPGGIWSYGGWNVLMLAISIVAAAAFRRRIAAV